MHTLNVYTYNVKWWPFPPTRMCNVTASISCIATIPLNKYTPVLFLTIELAVTSTSAVCKQILATSKIEAFHAHIRCASTRFDSALVSLVCTTHAHSLYTKDRTNVKNTCTCGYLVDRCDRTKNGCICRARIK
jgi:hypothetical protein